MEPGVGLSDPVGPFQLRIFFDSVSKGFDDVLIYLKQNICVNESNVFLIFFLISDCNS